MKITKSNLRRLIQEVWQEQLEVEEEVPEEAAEEDLEEDPEALVPGPSTAPQAKELRNVAEQLIRRSDEVGYDYPNAAESYDLIASALEAYATVLEQPIENIEGDPEIRQNLEENAYAIKRLKEKSWKTVKTMAGFGPGIVQGITGQSRV